MKRREANGRNADEEVTQRLPAQLGTSAVRPRRACRLLLWGICLLFLAGVWAGAAIYSASRADAPYVALQRFCTDLQSGHSDAAYRLVGAGALSAQSAQVFAEQEHLRVEADGPIMSCVVTHAPSRRVLGITLSAASATATLSVTRTRQYSGTVLLRNRAGSWQIVMLPEGSLGRPVAPLILASQYCEALASGRYAEAYAALTPEQQAGTGSAEGFAARLSTIFGGILRLQACELKPATYAISGTRASIEAVIPMRLSNGDTDMSVVNTVVFVLRQSAGKWQIAQQTLVP